MVYVVVGIILIGIIYYVLKKLADVVGGGKKLAIIIAISVVAFLAFSWIGVLGVIAFGVVVALIRAAGTNIGNMVKTHDKEKKDIAQIKQKTQINKQMHDNDYALLQELNRNCVYLGYIDSQGWLRKLPNYANKRYSTNFNDITEKFAMQVEQQNIQQNENWFQPFLEYIIAHPQGTTVTKMLNEVKCPQFQFTHMTSDFNILNSRMMKGTQRISKDVPPLFEYHNVKDIKEYLFVPTKYALKLYGINDMSKETANHTVEIDFDDL